MWNLISHFFSFIGGMAVGVVLMCLMQAVKQEDEWNENIKWRDSE